MAKVGFWLRGTRGKLAGASFSKGEDGQTIARQIVTPSNPKTAKQADQRSKIRPAAAFYKAFRFILNHSFLPMEPERKNRRKFMSFALGKDMPLPLILKGQYGIPTNVPYVISLGSINPAWGQAYPGAYGLGDNDDEFGFHLGVACPLQFTDQTTRVAEISASILDDNAALGMIEGMEITILALLIKNYRSEGTQYVQPAYVSFVLSRNDINPISTYINGGINLVGGDDLLNITPYSASDIIAAAGIIVSKKVDDSWDYTSSVLSCNPDVEYNNTFIAVRKSYMPAASSSSSDEILQQADNDTDTDPIPAPTNVANFVITPLNEDAPSTNLNEWKYGSGSDADRWDGKVAIYDDSGVKKFVTDGNGALLRMSSTYHMQYVGYDAGEGDPVTKLTTDMVNFNYGTVTATSLGLTVDPVPNPDRP